MRASTPRVLAALALALSLAGCGGNNPKPSPVVESSPAASVTATSGAPTMPAAAKGTDAEAAKAFVQHYFRVFSYASRTGDVTEMKALADPSCTSCSQVSSSIADVYAAGGQTTGRGYQVEELAVQKTSHNRMVLKGMVKQFAQKYTPSPSATVQSYPEGRFESVFTLHRVQDSWLLETWERL